MKKIICSYDDFHITEEDGKLFYYDEEAVRREVRLVHSVEVANQEENELMDGCGQRFDISGELDAEPAYCYWAFV